MQENRTVRKAAMTAGISLWQIAEKLGVSESTFHRWLRNPLPAEVEQKCLNAIHELEREVEGCLTS